MHPTANSGAFIRETMLLLRLVAAGEILCSLSSVFCPLRVERPARLEHSVGEVDELAHHSSDDRHLALTSVP